MKQRKLLLKVGNFLLMILRGVSHNSIRFWKNNVPIYKIILAAKLSKRTQQNVNKSQGKTFDDKFLSALAEREEPNRLAKMTSIIFIRDTNSKGQVCYFNYHNNFILEGSNCNVIEIGMSHEIPILITLRSTI